MGVYRAAIVTENGQNLIAQALANEKPLIFTSAKTSSYSYPVGTDVPALTGLQDVVQSVLPFDSKVLGGNVAQVSVRFDNDGVDQTYRIETIGLYAKIEGGAETLFSVTQATTPDEMPVQSDISPSAYIYNIQYTVQNASQITLTVNPAGTATVQDIMDIESPEFDDSGTVEGISSFPSFLETMKSKMNFFQFFRNLKAGLQFVLHAGQIVNNCVTDNAGLPLSAAQGKVLKDLYTQLYSEKVTGHPVNWYPNDKSLSSLIVGDVGIFTYGVKPDNAPSEKISEKAFGYGTLQVVSGRGDEGYGYGYAIYSGSLADVRQVFAVYERGTGWIEYTAKKNLESGYLKIKVYDSYIKLVQKTVSLSNGIGYIPLSEIFESFNPTYAIGVSHPVDLGSEGIALVDVSKDGSNMKIALNKSYTGTKWVSFIAIGSL